MRVVTPAELDLAVAALEAGELVIVPTRRWYMICCDASNADACSRIFTAKQRPNDKSLLFAAKSAEEVRRLFDVTAEAELLAAALWPGELALLLPWRNAQGALLQAVGTPLALVTHADDLLGALASRAACPVAATSANISGTDGSAPSISPAQVDEFVGKAGVNISIFVANGVCPTANHLTIVRCTDDGTEVVREGTVHRRAIDEIVGKATAI